MKGLNGKIGIVTGAARGIGRAIAERLCLEGTKVAMVDINPRVVETYNDIKKQYSRDIGFPFVADIAEIQDVQNLVRETIGRYGRIDILVNNAAISKPASPLVTTSEEDFDEIMNINFKGMFLCSAQVAKEMTKKKSGNIINIGSICGKSGHPYYSVYCASKAAGLAFTQAVAIELAPYNIRVNNICPGYTDTELRDQTVQGEAQQRDVSVEEIYEAELRKIPLRRRGKPEEVAAGVAFLASDEAQYITGQAINITGGADINV